MTTNMTPDVTWPPALATDPKMPATAKPLARPWIVLVVDDEPDILDSLKQLIERSSLGVKVIKAASGREGLEILERERVDLIVSDFKMPGMDGIEFLVQARRLRPGVPRLMFTAFANKELAHRAVSEALVTDFIAKSLSPLQMVRKVEALLHYDPESPAAPKEPPEILQF